MIRYYQYNFSISIRPRQKKCIDPVTGDMQTFQTRCRCNNKGENCKGMMGIKPLFCFGLSDERQQLPIFAQFDSVLY